MAYKATSLVVFFSVCHGQHARADFEDVTQIGKAIPKAFVPTLHMPRLSGFMLVNRADAVEQANRDAAPISGFPVHEAPLRNQFDSALRLQETPFKKQSEELKELTQHLRARVQPMPQADAKDAQYRVGFGILMLLMLSVGLVASIGIAVIQQHLARVQQALESMMGSQISTPQRSRSIMARAAVKKGGTLADSEDQAMKFKAVVCYWEPFELFETGIPDTVKCCDARVLRQAEIQHGRVAIAGFVSHIAFENGLQWPWVPVGDAYDSAFQGLSLPRVWDDIGLATDAQIILAVGLLEAHSESSLFLEKAGRKHYMRGGKISYFPPFDENLHAVHVNSYDFFKLNANASDEWKFERLLAEVNNGCLPLIGLGSFLSEAKVRGSVASDNKTKQKWREGTQRFRSCIWQARHGRCPKPSLSAVASSSSVVSISNPKTGQSVTLVGTVHGSVESKQQVRRLIETVQPNAVMIELDRSRSNWIGLDWGNIRVARVTFSEDIELQTMDTHQKAFVGVIARTIDMLDLGGMREDHDSEFLQAIRSAEDCSVCDTVILGDCGLVTIYGRIFKLLVENGELSELELKVRQTLLQQKGEDGNDTYKLDEVQVEKAMAMVCVKWFTFLPERPEFIQVLFQEREYFMSESIRRYLERRPEVKTVVGVVGRDHLPGMERHFKTFFADAPAPLEQDIAAAATLRQQSGM